MRRWGRRRGEKWVGPTRPARMHQRGRRRRQHCGSRKRRRVGQGEAVCPSPSHGRARRGRVHIPHAAFWSSSWWRWSLLLLFSRRPSARSHHARSGSIPKGSLCCPFLHGDKRRLQKRGGQPRRGILWCGATTHFGGGASSWGHSHRAGPPCGGRWRRTAIPWWSGSRS